MAEKNRFDLSRHIPKAVKKQVRRRCGFGCVVCGSAIVTYEHMNPRFRDAQVHNPNHLTLLCGAHQIESTKGLLSLETVQRYNADPIAKRQGFANHMFDLGGRCPVVVLGSCRMRSAQSHCGIFMIDRYHLLIEPPEPKSRLWRISAIFQDEKGDVVCEIRQNELLLLATDYDIEQVARRFVVIGANGHNVADMEVEPPITLHIQRMYIGKNQYFINIAPGGILDYRGNGFEQSELDGCGIIMHRDGSLAVTHRLPSTNK